MVFLWQKCLLLVEFSYIFNSKMCEGHSALRLHRKNLFLSSLDSLKHDVNPKGCSRGGWVVLNTACFSLIPSVRASGFQWQKEELKRRKFTPLLLNLHSLILICIVFPFLTPLNFGNLCLLILSFRISFLLLLNPWQCGIKFHIGSLCFNYSTSAVVLECNTECI